ncbi:hypothetical protein [Paenibacillus borealis]|uniref:hypothetical protein n=1 Tax=Paenibacillus borealis TaxID=160799 RepID=UPI0012FD9BC7|nr:hypothetical protein [Paenibacillus borealis]
MTKNSDHFPKKNMARFNAAQDRLENNIGQHLRKKLLTHKQNLEKAREQPGNSK